MGRSQTQNPKNQTSKKNLNSDLNKKGAVLAEALAFLKNQWSWSGSDLEEVTHIPTTTLNYWLSNGCIPFEERTSNNVQVILHLLAIHKNLDSMFEQPAHQIKWLETVHPDFSEPPLSQMKKSIEGLIGVRQYLDYVRGRGA